MKHMDHWVHLNQDFKSDIAWWQTFITWNGRGMMQSVATNETHRCFRDMGLWRLLGGQVDTRFVGWHVARNEHCHQGALTYSVGGSNVGSVLAG